jgi:hypothetical protein
VLERFEVRPQRRDVGAPGHEPPPLDQQGDGARRELRLDEPGEGGVVGRVLEYGQHQRPLGRRGADGASEPVAPQRQAAAAGAVAREHRGGDRMSVRRRARFGALSIQGAMQRRVVARRRTRTFELAFEVDR